MKMICDRTLLANAVAGVSKAVTQRSSIPVLEGILMKAEGFSLTLTGYDLEMGITTSIEANVLEPGEVVLSAKLLGDMVRRLSSSEVEITATETNATTIKGGITEFDIMGMNPGDFPELPSPGADHTLDLETPTFREMVETTLFAVSQDDKKPAHTGELFAIEPDKLTVVALDGYRLAIIEKPVKAAKDINIIIPAKTLAEAIKLFTDDDEVVHIAANRRFVVFSSRTYTVISRLIEGDFLDYKRVIPEGYHTRVTVDVRDFSNSIERASLIITERLKNPLRITFDGNITVRCQTTLGKVVDELDAEIDAGKLVLYYDGEKVKVGRGVNSLQTVSKGKGNPWKKIRVVESMDMIHDDLVLLAEDNYIGKYPNTYANKCLLISAINSYLAEMERNGIIEDYTIDLDVDAIKEYIIKNKGVTRDEAEAMSEAEIKKQYTDEKVFLAASATLVDVMEDINLNITV